MAALKRCGAIVADEERHACTDEVLRQAGMLASPEAREAERRKVFGVTVPKFHAGSAPHRNAEARAASPAANAAQPGAVAQAGPAPGQDEDQITLTVDKVTQRADGKIMLATSEGAVWRQVEDERILPYPRSGQTLTVSRTTFGGFMCHLSRWTSFRCTREP